MKKYFYILSITVLMAYIGMIFPVHAQNIEGQGMVADPKHADIVITQSEYALPYPGILPDHPLYFLKKFRDSVLEKLINEPIRKLEFYILQSDKELNAAIFLSSAGKNGYVNDVMSRSVQFKEKAIESAKGFKQNNKEIPGYIVERITNSLQKQQDVLSEMMTSAGDEQKKKISTWSATIMKLKADVDMLK